MPAVDVAANPERPLLDLASVCKTFKTSRWPSKPIHTLALDDVSLQVRAGEAVGIAGRSGSGKSTLVGAVCGLVVPDSGSICLDGDELYKRGKFDRSSWKRLQLVFQDPYTSLNPWTSVVESVAEPARFWHGKNQTESLAVARDLLDLVGLAGGIADRRPRSLSGGQRQRASIARALAAEPDLLILDESVSALDVSIQAQILDLLLQLRESRNLTYVLVSHDISVIRLVCDRVVVMNDGRIVEETTSELLTVDGVTEDYTRSLLEAVPTLRRES